MSKSEIEPLARSLLLIGAGLVLLPGCGSKPRAPALHDGPIYQNDREGFRFLVPEGWSQFARADVPAGKVSKERLLVQYRLRGAALEVTVDDLPATTDLAAYLAGPGFGVKKWVPAGPPEDLEIHNKPGTRWVFHGKASGVDMTREVVVFRRADRAYFFTGVFTAKDVSAREQIHKAIASTIWKN